SFSSGTIAQTTSSPTTAASTLSQSVIKAVQEALNRQGVSVETTGVLDDATRNALRRFQSQHHLPVTGEADRATLGKLGVADQPSTFTHGSGSVIGSRVVIISASPDTGGCRNRRNDERPHDAGNDEGHDANHARNDGHDGRADAVSTNAIRTHAT